VSFSVTLFGPSHYWWRCWRDGKGGQRVPRAWFYQPDESSTGGVGFCIPGLHVVFTWGRKP
jgi:hypothetical protein